MAIDGMDEVPNTAKVGEGAMEINKTRQYIADRTAAVTPIAKGGTAGTTAAAARTNLGVPWDGTGSALKFTNPAFGVLSFEIPGLAYPTSLASAASVDGKVNRSGDTITGDLVVNGQIFIPNSYAVSGGYVSAWITSDGRIGKTASARRFKENIDEVDPLSLGDLFPELVEYSFIDGDGSRTLGYIADDMEGTDAERFVTYDSAMRVEAYDIIGLLLAQVANLNARLRAYEERGENGNIA